MFEHLAVDKKDVDDIIRSQLEGVYEHPAVDKKLDEDKKPAATSRGKKFSDDNVPDRSSEPRERGSPATGEDHDALCVRGKQDKRHPAQKHSQVDSCSEDAIAQQQPPTVSNHSEPKAPTTNSGESSGDNRTRDTPRRSHNHAPVTPPTVPTQPEPKAHDKPSEASSTEPTLVIAANSVEEITAYWIEFNKKVGCPTPVKSFT